MDMSGDMPVTLVIKAPNQRMEDQTVDCMLGWTIRKLKQHLESVYPSNPKHNEQRLIYSGKLLQDHLTLKEILREYDTSEKTNKHTVHLVCSSKHEASASSAAASQMSNTSSSSSLHHANSRSSVAQPSSSATVHSTPVAGQGEGVRYRGHVVPPPVSVQTSQYQFPSGMIPGTQYTPDANTQYAQLTPEQYSWMVQQQMYSQYMAQYMQYYQNMYYPGLPGSTQPMPYPAAPLQAPNLQQPPAQPQEVPAPPAQPAANNGPPRANMRMNAQGGMEEDEDDDGDPRDWLHHIYFFMRFLTFLGILFFYSSFTRFLLVFSGSFAIYFLQKLRKYIQRTQRNQEQQSQQQGENQPDQEGAAAQNGEEERREGEQREDSGVGASQQPDGEQPEHTPETDDGQARIETEQQQPEVEEGGRLSRMFLFVMTTVQTFFTSLLPTPPELLDAN